MLASWHEFYGLLGTGAAALLALLFVAASLGASVFNSTPDSRRATGIYMSPVVFHYANILFLSLIALVPGETQQSFGVIIGIAALGSLGYAIFNLVRVWAHSMADIFDRIAYGVVPALCYASGLVTAWLILTGRTEAGLNVLAGAAMLLLVTNIRNAWDLMISLARRAAETMRNNPQPPNQPPSP